MTLHVRLKGLFKYPYTMCLESSFSIVKFLGASKTYSGFERYATIIFYFKSDYQHCSLVSRFCFFIILLYKQSQHSRYNIMWIP